MNTNQAVSHAVGLNLDVSKVRVPEPAFSLVPCLNVRDLNPDRSSNPANIFGPDLFFPEFVRNLSCVAGVI